MSGTEPQKELEELLTRAEIGTLDAPGERRLHDLLRDEDLLDTTLDQLETEALLRWQFGATDHFGSAPPTRQTARLTRDVVAISAAAAVVLVAVTIWFSRTPPRRPHVSDTSALAKHEAQVRGWRLVTYGAARMEVDRASTVHLERGELHAVAGPNAEPLRVVTRQGAVDTAPAGQAHELIVASHSTANATEDLRDAKDQDMRPDLTRLLVLAGMATLANAQGSASVRSGELAIAERGQSPKRIVSRGIANFGFRLYRELAKSRPHDNLFFSPVSVTNLLTAAGVGARGETAAEIARVLGIPTEARHVSEDAQRIPIAIARHGHRAIQRLLNEKNTPQQRELRDQHAKTRAELEPLLQGHERARRARDWKTMGRIEREARILTRRFDREAARIRTYELAIANALWVERSLPLADRYRAELRRDFGNGAIRDADFAGNPRVEIARINAWAAEQTRGKIPAIVDGSSVGTTTQFVLLNAIYFLGEWRTPFHRGYTSEQTFTAADGARVRVPFMRHYSLEDARYAAFDSDGRLFASPKMVRRGQKDGLYPGKGGVQLVELPYRGDDLVMLILLPTERSDLATLEEKLDAEVLDRWVGALVKRKIRIAMPKWRTRASYSLREPLERLGMKRAFASPGADGADFSRMTDGRARLNLQTIEHRAYVSVDERGTEAAAITSIAAGAADPDVKPFVPYVRADRPFVYAIRDLRSGTILFLGRVANPDK